MKFNSRVFISLFFFGLNISAQYALADGWEAGPTVGMRFGGRLVENQAGQSLTINSSPAVGFFVGRLFDNDNKQAEFVYSRQESDVDLNGLNGIDDVDVTVEQYYLGLTQLYWLDGSEQFRPFIEGLIGATNFNPDGFESHLFFSLGAAGGFKYFATRALGFRLDARVYGTFTNGNTAIACSGGCVANYMGTVTWQGEITPSLFFHF